MSVTSPASMSKVFAEFLAPVGTPLTAFVRGGAYVPNVAANSGVPTAPPISLTQMVGAVRYTNLSLSGPTTANGGAFTPGGPPTASITSVGINLTISGGNPGPSISWAYVSGNNTMTIIGGTGVSNVRWNSTVSAASPKIAIWRCTVSDGVSSATRDVQVTLEYDNS